MVEKTRFGILLKRYRQIAGLSQEALADRAGLSVRAISDLERGINRAPRSSTLELLAGALSLTSQQRDLLIATTLSGIDVVSGGDVNWAQSNVPIPPTRLIGREAERIQVLDLLRSAATRLLTLTGPSGVGKTRFALQLARDLASDFPDGILFVPLATIRDPLRVPEAVAQAIQIHETPTTSIGAEILANLQDKHLLLILDNLEQILDCSPFIANLLANCPRLVILATSRSPLRLRAEREHLLAPLPLNDAVDLFYELAQAAQPSITFPQAEVAFICEQLDCLPLAIELAATHTRVLSLPELQKQLTRRFALLRGGSRDLPARQQTMENAIAWSYELLTEQQQRGFRALGIFVGSWTLEASEAVCWAKDEIVPEDWLLIITAIVEASLVQTEIDASGNVRFSMLKLVRDYALERLHAAGEAGLCQRRHATYYARLADTAEALFESGPVKPNLLLSRELPNVEEALQWSEESREAELGLRLTGFTRLWHILGQPSHARRWLEHMLALDQWARTNGNPVAPLSLRIEKLYGLGRVLLGIGQMERAEAVTHEALILAQQIGDEKEMANAWATLGLIAQANRKLEEAEKAFDQSALYAGHSGDARLKYRALSHLAEIARERSDLNRAAVLLEEALATAQTYPNGWDTAIIITLLGHLARQQLNYPLAKERYTESLKQLRSFGSPTYTAWSLEGCAALLCAEGHGAAAVRLCAVAANLRKQADTPLPDNERKAHQQVIAKIEDLLGPQAFQQEWAAGAEYTQDQAIEFALLELA